MQHKIFISHAHSDADLVREFVALLALGLGIDSTAIFCTSSARKGIEPGGKFTKEIQAALNDCTLALALVSDAFYSSSYCLCELGAIWGREKRFIPIMIPPLKHSDLKAVIGGLHSVRIDNIANMHELHDSVVAALGLPRQSAAIWNEALDRFLSNFPLFYRNSSQKRQRGETFLNSYATTVCAGLHRSIARMAPSLETPEIFLLALDIDRQKQINKRHGIAVGDEVLDKAVEVFASYEDRFFEGGQCGDDTYFAIFAGTDIEAYFLAEEILGSVRDIGKSIRVQDLWVTASVGITKYTPGCHIDAWKTNTHHALEKARQSGGNTAEFGIPPQRHYIPDEREYSWGS